MSDTEDDADGADATDGFDKEAEREKLREKYEREEQRREATQRMSELLLKGATMTNAHCGECGSPIFRYDGEEFCPTCRGTREVVEEDADAGEETPGTAAEPATGGRDERPTAAGADPLAAAGAQPADEGDDGPTTGEEASGAGSSGSKTGEPSSGQSRSRTAGSSGTGTGSGRQPVASQSSDSPVLSGEVPSLAQTRASLRRAIVSLSEQAAQSDDPGRAHDLLKGSREAAEALAALQGARE